MIEGSGPVDGSQSLMMIPRHRWCHKFRPDSRVYMGPRHHFPHSSRSFPLLSHGIFLQNMRHYQDLLLIQNDSLYLLKAIVR